MLKYKYVVNIILNNGKVLSGYYKTEHIDTSGTIKELFDGVSDNSMIAILNECCTGCVYIRASQISSIELIPDGNC